MANYGIRYGGGLTKRSSGTTPFAGGYSGGIGTIPGSPAWQAQQPATGGKYSAADWAAPGVPSQPSVPSSQRPNFGRYGVPQSGASPISQPVSQPVAQQRQGFGLGSYGRGYRQSLPQSQGGGGFQQQPVYSPQQSSFAPSAYSPQQSGFDYSQITGMFEQAMAEANKANEARYQEGLGIYGQIADIYKPGGGFGAGHEAQLGRTKTRDVAAAQQQMVSSGLWGTTVAAAIPAAWEETVGQPSRLALQDVQMGRYGEALAGQAGFIERRSDVGPDMGLFANLMQGAYAGPMGQQTGGQRYGTPPAGGGKKPTAKKPTTYNIGGKKYGAGDLGKLPGMAGKTLAQQKNFAGALASATAFRR